MGVVILVVGILMIFLMVLVPLVAAWISAIIALLLIALGCWFVASYKRGGNKDCDAQTYKKASIAAFGFSVTFVILFGASIYINGTQSHDYNEDYSPSNTYSYSNNSYNYKKNESYGFSDYLKETDPDLYNAIKDRYDSLK